MCRVAVSSRGKSLLLKGNLENWCVRCFTFNHILKNPPPELIFMKILSDVYHTMIADQDMLKDTEYYHSDIHELNLETKN